MSRKYVSVVNEKYILDEWKAFSHGCIYVSISCFKVQISVGHLVWFFDSGNSIVSWGNWCPHQKPFTMHKSKCPALKLEILHPNQKGTMQVIIGRWPLVHIIYEVILEKADHFIWKWMNCDKRCYVMSLRLTLLKISRSQGRSKNIPWAARNRVQSMNEHIRVCFLLWPHQIYISIGEKLADFQQIWGGEQASDFKFPSRSSRARIWVTFLC